MSFNFANFPSVYPRVLSIKIHRFRSIPRISGNSREQTGNRDCARSVKSAARRRLNDKRFRAKIGRVLGGLWSHQDYRDELGGEVEASRGSNREAQVVERLLGLFQ